MASPFTGDGPTTAAGGAGREIRGAGPVAPLPCPAPPLVGTRHFEAALLRVGPSVSRKDVRQYDAIRLRLRANAPLGGAGGGVAVTTVGKGAASTSGGGGCGGMPMGEEPSAVVVDEPGMILAGGIHGLGAGFSGFPTYHHQDPRKAVGDGDEGRGEDAVSLA